MACSRRNRPTEAQRLTTRIVPDATGALCEVPIERLTGDSFKRWIGRTLGEKFEIMRDTMPPRDERSLPDEVYLDILMFILRANKVPVGPHELKRDPETLRQITIAEPK